MDTEKKLAIAVAAVIGVGFASIVGLSLLGRGPSEDDRTVMPARISASAPAAVQPASVDRPAAQPPAPVSAGTPEEADGFTVEPGVNYLARGIEAYQARNLDHAIAYLMAEIETRPDRPYSHYLLGLSLWKSDRLDEAVDALTRSAELDPGAVRTFINLSRVQNDRGDFDAALEAAWKALDLDDSDPAAHFLEGRSLRNLGELDKAVASLNRSLEIDPENGYVWNLLGLTLLAREDDPVALQDALTALQEASSLEGEVAYIQNNLGMALERSGHPVEAVAAYRRAVELDAGHERAGFNLARLEPTVPVDGDPEDAGVEVAMEPAAGEGTD